MDKNTENEPVQISCRKKINKSKRLTVQIPEGTEVYNLLFDNDNTKCAKWEILNQIIKQLPKSKQDRSYALYLEFSARFSELYPGNERALQIIWVLIAKRLMKIPNTDDGRERFLPDSFFEELKKI